MAPKGEAPIVLLVFRAMRVAFTGLSPRLLHG